LILFYANGEKVWNRLQQVMPSGSGLKGHASSTQSSIILPQPISNTRFYVFTTDAVENNYQNGFRYSVVDMCLDNGKGDIIANSKNVLLTDSVNEKLIAIPHSNGTDYWLVVHKLYSDAFYSFRLTNTGIVDTIISHSGNQDLSGVGQMKASPNGQRIAYCSTEGIPSFTSILDFDASTGVVSNEQLLSSGNTEYATSFSPDNSKLYFSTLGHGEIFQYNMNAGSISAIITSKTHILNGPDSWRQIQLGPDGKIYLSRTGKLYLSAIEFPDSLYPACSYIDSAVYLGGKYTSFGLPNFLAGFNYANTIVQCHTGILQIDLFGQSLKVYPNPAEGIINVELPEQETFSLYITDIAGRIVYDAKKVNGKILIDCGHFCDGIYFIQAMNEKKNLNCKIFKL
jgi:hypothetical protein